MKQLARTEVRTEGGAKPGGGNTAYYLERVLEEAACTLIRTPDEKVDHILQTILGCAACAGNAERGFLFQRVAPGGEYRLSHHWAAAHVPVVPDPSWRADYDVMPLATEMVRRAEAFELQARTDALPEDSGELAAMRRKGLRSLLAVPLRFDSETVAVIGLSTLTYEMSWSRTEITLLRAIGAVLLSNLVRVRRTADLAHKDRTIRTLVDATPEIAILADREGRILHTNAAFARALESMPADLVGESVIDLAPPDTQDTRRRLFNSVLQSQATLEVDIDIDDRIFSMFLSPVTDGQGNVTQVAIFGRDVTTQRAAEERRSEYEQRLRELANEITLAEERQRKALATELHDRVTQPLVALRLKMATFDSAHSHHEPLMNDLSQLLRHAITATDTITREIASPTLAEQGLPAALESLAHAFTRRHSLEVRPHVDGPRWRLARETEVLLYQAAREFLMNAVKHANASVVELSLLFAQDRITLTAVDDGLGLRGCAEADDNLQSSGFGLFILRERLHLMGGTLQLSESDEGGTRVEASIPRMTDPARGGLAR